MTGFTHVVTAVRVADFDCEKTIGLYFADIFDEQGKVRSFDAGIGLTGDGYAHDE